jgi:hypothetical protein
VIPLLEWLLVEKFWHINICLRNFQFIISLFLLPFAPPLPISYFLSPSQPPPVERSVSNIYDRRPKDKITGAASVEEAPTGGVATTAIENLAESTTETNSFGGNALSLASPGATSNKAFRRDIPNRRYGEK